MHGLYSPLRTRLRNGGFIADAVTCFTRRHHSVNGITRRSRRRVAFASAQKAVTGAMRRAGAPVPTPDMDGWLTARAAASACLPAAEPPRAWECAAAGRRDAERSPLALAGTNKPQRKTQRCGADARRSRPKARARGSGPRGGRPPGCSRRACPMNTPGGLATRAPYVGDFGLVRP